MGRPIQGKLLEHIIIIPALNTMSELPDRGLGGVGPEPAPRLHSAWRAAVEDTLGADGVVPIQDRVLPSPTWERQRGQLRFGRGCVPAPANLCASLIGCWKVLEV